ncbi:hypothetical protein CAC42_5535 [Sphaceloma murrayae]|uniref:MAGE domain-containing protein n=1 Tax=Sphaceloma murrayae TaxID=2082308 RepID=A0A2K1QYG4_9PEZI|nr:hypothetical protein CAC42_5535 [Sphaceloma murrayae]
MPKRKSDSRNDPGPSSQSQRRRVSGADEEDGYGDDSEGHMRGDSNQEQMVKDLVRLALACEYTRAPLRRSDINSKVLESRKGSFKTIFAAAQQRLREVFGMELVELPVRDKITMQQKKQEALRESREATRRAEAAAKQREAGRKPTQSQSESQTSAKSNAWILSTILPEEFRTPDILPPPAAPTTETESQYIALSSFIVSVIMLSGGTLAETKLERYLTRANVNETTPFTNSIAFNALDKTEKLVKKMEKDGLIIKVKDNSSGDETIEYVLGPRGKLEIGVKGVEGLVREVYGETDDQDDFESRLKRSLQIAGSTPRERPEAAA